MTKARRTPADASGRFAEAINAGDLEGALACWSAVGVIATAGGFEVRGHAELTERFQALIAADAHLDVLVSDEVCTEHGASAATRMTMSFPTDDQPRVLHLEAVVTYVPGPGGLQILIDRISPHAG